jgi:DNA polymerase V
MMNIIGRFAPEQYVYSIDETFLSFKNCSQVITDLESHGRLIQRTVWKEAKLPVCVGLGPTLTLAKIANRAAKKLPEFRGVCVIDNDQVRIQILKQIDVEDVWGIGRRLSVKLRLMNIKTAYDLSNMAAGLARKTFSIEVERTVRELNGQVCKMWDQVKADKKQIFSTRSVGERITEFEQLKQALSKHVCIAAAKARRQGSVCKTVLIFATNSPHDERPSGFKSVIHLPYPTNSTVELSQAVSQSASTLFREGVRYYKIGVGLLDLTSEKNCQLDLFNASKANPALMNILDQLNEKYGRNTLFLAAQGTEQKWDMRREFLTPQYSTKWHSLPRIKC